MSLDNALGVELKQDQLPVPYAASYRIGEPVPGGNLLAFWRRPLTIGESLPILPLPLTVEHAVAVDLNATYANAARDAYLS